MPDWSPTARADTDGPPPQSDAYDPPVADQPAPKRFPDRDEVAAVRAEAEPLENGGEIGETRRLAGRAMARRGMGKLVFLDLVDRSGRIQVHLRRRGDRRGRRAPRRRRRRRRPAGEVAPRRALGARRRASRCSPGTRSPLPDTFHGLTDVELRYRKRYLDLLMNEETRDVFVTRARIVTAIRRYARRRGFVEVETPILQPRYGGAFARPFVDPPQRARRRPLPPHRDRAVPQAADRRRASSASTRSARTSATRGSRTSTTPSSRCSSGTRPTPTTATRWTGSSCSSSASPARSSGRPP